MASDDQTSMIYFLVSVLKEKIEDKKDFFPIRNTDNIFGQ